MTDVNVFIETFTHKVTTALCSVSVEQIKSAIAALRACCTRSGRVYVFGNGGSYAMAGHWSSDLNKAILYRRGRKRTQSDFCVVRLPMSDAELTAWANDSGYDSVFAGPLMHLVRPADLVIALSCSGNSLNVLNAVNVAKQLAGFVLDEDNGEKDRHIGQRRGQNGAPHLGRPVECRLHPGLAHFPMPKDVFKHHNRVVHDIAHGKRQTRQHDNIQGAPQGVEDDEHGNH